MLKGFVPYGIEVKELVVLFESQFLNCFAFLRVFICFGIENWWCTEFFRNWLVEKFSSFGGVIGAILWNWNRTYCLTVQWFLKLCLFQFSKWRTSIFFFFGFWAFSLHFFRIHQLTTIFFCFLCIVLFAIFLWNKLNFPMMR